MLKLAVLFAVAGVVVSEPGALIAGNVLSYSSFLSPSTTTITKQASSVVHPSPLYYSVPLAYPHFIKKRSAPLGFASRIFSPITYGASLLKSVYTTPYLQSPFHSSTWAYRARPHFIKKRSLGLAFPSTYLAPATYAAPYLATPYAPATHVLSAAPVITHGPLAYTHLIKKRSSSLLASTYLAPTAYSSHSRVDIRHEAPQVTTTTYSAPLGYSNPLIYY